jgi:CRISPR/Cas system-associated exonuclease Cas4 (RecB family)
MGFKVADISYFMVCNGEKSPDRFDAKMDFAITLVDYETNTNWIKEKILEMKSVLDSADAPNRNPYCENCAYIEQAAKM